MQFDRLVGRQAPQCRCTAGKLSCIQWVAGQTTGQSALSTSVSLRPPLRPPTVQERKMNMISPLAGSSMWHADIETGKVRLGGGLQLT